MNPITAVCVGGIVIVLAYFACLTIVGGLPDELRKRLTRRRTDRIE